MLDDSVSNVRLLVGVVAYQIGLLCWLGDAVSKMLYRTSAVRLGLPEFSFLVGMGVYFTQVTPISWGL